MTEQEWLTCTDPTPMLEFLNHKASDRKVRLFAVACCRRLLHSMTDERSRTAVEVAEKWADHLVNEIERRNVQAAAQDVWDYDDDDTGLEIRGAWVADVLVRGEFIGDAWAFRGEDWASLVASEVAEEIGFEEQFVQASLARCVLGSPFRSIALNPVWLTSTVLALAERMYDSRDFSALPILADALQDAGCNNADILNHCRSEGPHVRGCWVVDLLLDKS